MSDHTWDSGSVDLTEDTEWDDLPGAERVPSERYVEHNLLGRGGMGEVRLAHDAVLRRQVAIKRCITTSPTLRRRLEREARITAALDHPNIVAVYDAGLDEAGQPWYAMRVIRGRTLQETLRAGDLEARLRLVRSLLASCQAVAHAHAMGIVHRDLKPENIVVGAFGETQVLDWGVARPMAKAAGEWDALLASTASPEAAHTVAGAIVGSPPYMSPEAAMGDGGDVASDVWSLGVCLYELLTNTRPFPANTPHEVLDRVIVEEVPDPRTIEPAAPAELAAVVARACHRDPEQRYASVVELIEDLEAWLDGRRVSAFNYTPVDALIRVVRRYWAVFTTLAVAAAAVTAVGFAGWWRTEQARAAAEEAREVAEQETQRAEAYLAEALIGTATTAALAGARPESETLAAAALAIEEDPRARGLTLDFRPRPTREHTFALPRCSRSPLSPDGALLLCHDRDTLIAFDVDSGEERWRRSGEARSVRVGTDTIVAHGPSQELELLDPATGEARPSPALSSRGSLSSSSWHPRYAGFTERPGVAQRLDLETGEGDYHWSGQRTTDIGVRQDGTFIFMVGSDMMSWRPDQPEPEVAWAGAMTLDGKPEIVASAALTPDGRWALMGTWNGHIILLDLETRERRVWTRFEGMVQSASLSQDGARLAVLDDQRAAWVWSVDGEWARLPGIWNNLGFQEDGAVTLVGQQVAIWRMPGDEVVHRHDLGRGITNLDWGPGLLAASLGSGQILGWDDAGTLTHRAVVSTDNVAKDVAVDPEGGRIRGAGLGVPWVLADGLDQQTEDPAFNYCRRVVWLKTLSACSPNVDGPLVLDRQGAPLPQLIRPGEMVVDMEPNPERESLVLSTNRDRVHVLTGGASPSIRLVDELPGLLSVALFTGPEADIVVGLKGAVERIGPDGETRWSVDADSFPLEVAVSPDGRWVAAGYLDGALHLLDAASGRLVADIPGHTERVVALAFSPDGRRLASGGWDDTVRIWDLRSLDLTPEALQADIERSWGLTLESAMAQ